MLDNGHVGAYDPASGVFSSASRPATDAEAAILTAELTSDPATRGYAGKDAQTTADLLNGTYSVPNPMPRATIPVTSMPREAFLHLISDLLFQVASLPDSAAKTTVLAIASVQIPLAAAVNTVSLTGLAVQSIFAQLMALGVVTQVQVAAITTQPDPTYQAQIAKPSRASVIFGSSITVEASDIPGAAS